MPNNIAEKLKPILLGPVRSKERVVYILVQARKLLEHADPPKEAYTTLRFYCSWFAHTRLTRGEGTLVVKAMAFSKPGCSAIG